LPGSGLVCWRIDGDHTYGHTFTRAKDLLLKIKVQNGGELVENKNAYYAIALTKFMQNSKD
jgi:hypothetical protein